MRRHVYASVEATASTAGGDLSAGRLTGSASRAQGLATKVPREDAVTPIIVALGFTVNSVIRLMSAVLQTLGWRAAHTVAAVIAVVGVAHAELVLRDRV